jgi:hypothetical protein
MSSTTKSFLLMVPSGNALAGIRMRMYGRPVVAGKFEGVTLPTRSYWIDAGTFDAMTVSFAGWSPPNGCTPTDDAAGTF